VNFAGTFRKRLVFSLSKREKSLLLRLLTFYPCIPPAHHQPLSRSTRLPDPEGSQGLLDEALAEQRADNKKQIEALLAHPGRFQEDGTGVRFSVSPTELEWLLQVLNDIRIGNWIRLGSPEEKIGAINEQTAPHLWAMELAGYFQSNLLEAFGEM
jgi:hypothetical protein